MGGILAFLLVGIVGLAYWYGVMPETETTVLSQLAMNILGHNLWLLFCSGYNSNDFSFSGEYRFYKDFQCLPLAWRKINICRVCLVFEEIA